MPPRSLHRVAPLCLTVLLATSLSGAPNELGAQSRGASPNAVQPKVAQPPLSLRGTWRVTRGVAAPWVSAKDARPDTSAWLGKTIQFGATAVSGPDVIKCGNAHYEATSVPAEGLFQGMESKAPKADALKVGIGTFPVPGTSLNCDTGLFEFHFPDRTTALVAISNAIYTLDRSPGALAIATSPEGVTQRFLEKHFTGKMSFEKANVARKTQFISADLNALITRYLGKPASPNEAPEINGDPFTDSQEYPVRFSVGSATSTGAETSAVQVRFTDGMRTRIVTYQLRRENNVWRIDDLRYDSGPTFRALLAR